MKFFLAFFASGEKQPVNEKKKFVTKFNDKIFYFQWAEPKEEEEIEPAEFASKAGMFCFLFFIFYLNLISYLYQQGF